MAVIKFINNKVSLKKTLSYICKDEKTEHKLISGKDCVVENAYSEMMMIKNQFNKTGEREKIHFIQSFSPNDPLDYETAHEIGVKLMERYEGFKEFQIVMATHEDKDHIHNHFVINSVNYKTGKKIQFSEKDLKKIKEISNELCKEYGISVIKEKAKVDDIKINELNARKKGNSWKEKLSQNIDIAMVKANNKYEFFKYMNSLGYKVTWTKERKNITYTTPNGYKCRDRKLHDEKYLKENMEKYFKEKYMKLKIKGFKKNGHIIYKSMSFNIAEIIKQFKKNENEEQGKDTQYSYSKNDKKQYAMETHYSLEELEDIEL